MQVFDLNWPFANKNDAYHAWFALSIHVPCNCKHVHIFTFFSVIVCDNTTNVYQFHNVYSNIFISSVSILIFNHPPNRIWSHHNPVYSNNDSVFLQYIILSLRFCPSSIFWMQIKCIFKGLQQFVLIWQQLICQTFKWWLLTMVSEMYSSNTKSK